MKNTLNNLSILKYMDVFECEHKNAVLISMSTLPINALSDIEHSSLVNIANFYYTYMYTGQPENNAFYFIKLVNNVRSKCW